MEPREPTPEGVALEQDEPTAIIPVSMAHEDDAKFSKEACLERRTALVAAEVDQKATLCDTALRDEDLSRGPDAVLPAANLPATEDSTKVIISHNLVALSNDHSKRGETSSNQDWLEHRMREFAYALYHNQQGEPRTPNERQVLVAAARDMIQRIGHSHGNSKSDEHANTVLHTEQLLANTYLVRGLIARGGVGEIYRARHRDLKTEHAIKILLPRHTLDATMLNLFIEEARLLQLVRHDAVVGCQGLLRDSDGRLMLVMDYLRGQTLAERLREGAIPTPELLRLVQRLASGLASMHALGIIHQDLSPDNILLVDYNCSSATIMDFGLARGLDTPETTQSHIDFGGKLSWCSPEQLAKDPAKVGASSDLYSLGLVVAAAARGVRLDMGHDLVTARFARRSPPSLAGIDEPVAMIIRQLLTSSPAGRMTSANELVEWLKPKSRRLIQRLYRW